MYKLLLTCLLALCLTSQPVGAAWWFFTGSPVGGGSSTTEATVGTETASPPDTYGIDYTTRTYCGKLSETPSENGTLLSISAAVSDTNATAPFKLGLYTHDGTNDMPDSLVANSVTDEGTMTATMTVHTLDVSGSASVVSGTQYWICLEQTDGWNVLGHDNSGSYKISNKNNADSYDWPDFDGTSNGGDDTSDPTMYFTYEY